MVIHIGNDNVIRSGEILAIVEYDLIASSTIMQEMIEEKRKNKKVVGPIDQAKSVIITDDIVYFSSLSVLTLNKRSSIESMLSKTKEYTNQLEE